MLTYADYPATGSAFAGPWRARRAFCRGVCVQGKFDGPKGAREWEPQAPALRAPWHTGRQAPSGGRSPSSGPVACRPHARGGRHVRLSVTRMLPRAPGRACACSCTWRRRSRPRLRLLLRLRLRMCLRRRVCACMAPAPAAVRAAPAPAHDARHSLLPACFAGKWVANGGRRFAVDTIVIEEGGDGSSWFVAAGPHRRTGRAH